MDEAEAETSLRLQALVEAFAGVAHALDVAIHHLDHEGVAAVTAVLAEHHLEDWVQD